MNSNRIVISGDSILKGVVLNDATRSYTISGRLATEPFSARYGLEIENKSRFGSTIGKGLTQLERTLAKNGECRAVILEYGGNDCDFDWAAIAADPDGEHLPKTPLPDFCAQLRAAVGALRARGIDAVLTNLPPISAERYLNWICRAGLDRDAIVRWLGDVSAIYRYQERYSRAIEAVAAELGAPCVDLRGEFLRHRQLEPYLCMDGIHPNEAGQAFIMAAFSAFAEQELRPEAC